MAKKKIHRVCVYLLNPERNRVLLGKPSQGLYAGQYVAPSAHLNEAETPVETAQKILARISPDGYQFLGHEAVMPVLLDNRTLRLFPPFQLQLTAVDAQKDFVDYVYLAQAAVQKPFREGDVFCWFDRSNVKETPPFIQVMVGQILSFWEAAGDFP